MAGQAQETTTLDGEPALRFLVAHGHVRTYCEGLLWVTPTRVRYQSLTKPEHSFAWPKSAIKEFRAVDTFGLHYIKMEAGGETYRLGIYPGIGDWYDDRLAFLVRAVNDFAAARAEVVRVETERSKNPPAATVVNTPEGPALRFPVLAAVVPGPYLTPRRPGRDVVFAHPTMRAQEAYGEIPGTTWGGLEISAGHTRFQAESGSGISFNFSQSEFEILSGAGGYPRIVLRTRDGNLFAFYYAQRAGEKITYLDAAPILQALGTGYGELLARLQPKPKPNLLLVSHPGGAEVYVNDGRQGTTSAEGSLLLRSLEPGDYRLRLSLPGYQDWTQLVRLELGEERRLEATLVSVGPPKPNLHVVSKPGGAEVYLNDQRQGTTGAEGTLLLRALEPGDYRLRLSLPGYQDWTDTVRLEPGDERRLEVTLAPVKPPEPAIRALSLDDVVRLLEAGVTPARVAALVRDRGVDFALSNEAESRLRRAGANSDLLLEIAKARK